MCVCVSFLLQQLCYLLNNYAVATAMPYLYYISEENDSRRTIHQSHYPRQIQINAVIRNIDTDNLVIALDCKHKSR